MNLYYKKLSKYANAAFVAFCVFVFCGIASLALPDSAQAAFNPTVNYQAKLTATTSIAVPDGSYNFRFKLYTTLTGGSPIWTETWCNTSTCDGLGTGSDNRIKSSSGLITTMLGGVTSLSGVNFNQPLYLSVEVGGSGATASWDGEMSPRKILGTVPSAFVAQTLNGYSDLQFIRSDTVNATTSTNAGLTVTQNGAGDIANLNNSSGIMLVVKSNGNVGIGTSTPAYGLDVETGSIRVNNNIIGAGQSGTIYLGDGSFTKAYGGSWVFYGGANVTNGGIGNNGAYSATTDFILKTGGSDAAGGAAGTERMRILNANGNVGIGTTTPAVKLDIFGGQIALQGATGNDTLRLGGGTAGTGVTIESINSSRVAYAPMTQYATTFNFNNGSINRLNIDSGGGVQIGTTTNSLGEILTIASQGASDSFINVVGNSSNQKVVLGTSGTNGRGFVGEYSNAGFDVRTNNQSRMTFDTSGNIGIGTTTPTAKLDISDNNAAALRITSNASAAGGIVDSQVLFRNYNTDKASIGWDVTANTLNFGVGSVTQGDASVGTAMTIGTSGNIGIGTTSPLARLDVMGNSSTALNVFDSQAGTTGTISFKRSDGWNPSTIQNVYPGGGYEGQLNFNLHPADGILATTPSTVMTIRGNGNVGIGTNAPGRNLEIRQDQDALTGLIINNANSTSNSRIRLSFSQNTTEVGLMQFNPASNWFQFGSLKADSDVRIGNFTSGTSPKISFYPNNSEAVTMLANGNVGIGTTSPFVKLGVAGSAYIGGNLTATGTLSIGGNTALGGTLNVTGATTLASSLSGLLQATNGLVSSVATSSLGLGASFFQQNGNSFGTTATVGTNDAQSLALETNGSTKMTILSGGNVGIGTSSPLTRLTVTDNNANLEISGQTSTQFNGTTLEAIDRQGTGRNDLNLYTGVGNVKILTAGTERFRVANNGNVGIGTTTPGAKLDVNGSYNLGRPLTMNDSGNTLGGPINFAPTNLSNGINGYLRLSYPSATVVNFGTNYDGSLTGSTYPDIQFGRTGTTPYLTIKDGGNIGIGTTSPSGKLSISAGSNSADSAFIINPTVGGNRTITFTNNILQSSYSNNNAQGPLYLQPAISTTAGFINGVGIGTSSSSGLNAALAVRGGGTGTNRTMALYNSSDTENLTVLDNGSVGIGTTSPSQIFSVQGGGLFSGNITAANMTATGTLSVAGNAALGGTLNVTGATTLASSLSGLLQATNGLVSSIATSTLGLGNNTFLGLKDTISSYNAGRVLYEAAAGAVDSSGFTFDGTTLTAPIFSASQTSGTSTFAGGLAVGTSKFVVNNFNGNVGIGTTTPATTLDINKPAGGEIIRLEASGQTVRTYGLGIDPVSTNFYIKDNYAGLNRLTVDTSGNVGIGTTTPTQKLDVSGVIRNYGGAQLTGIQLSNLSSSPDYGSAIYMTNDLGSSMGATRIRASYNGVGTAGNPNFAIDRSTNNGTYGSDPSLLTYTNSLTINGSNGNVGIGTTTPSDKLEVVGGGIKLSTTGSGQFLNIDDISAGGGGSRLIKFTNSGSNSRYNWLVGSNYTASNIFEITPSTATGGSTYSNPALVVTNNGLVGIGTTTPISPLSVYGTGGLTLSNTAGYGGSVDDNGGSLNLNANGAGAFQTFKLGGAEFMRINPGGNVGIGTTSPAAQLHIFNSTAANANGQEILRLSGVTSSGTVGSGPYVNFTDTLGNNIGNIRSYTEGAGLIGMSLGTLSGGSVSERLHITAAGNVGIGTTSPTNKLEVAGNGYFSGNITGANLTATGTVSVAGNATIGGTLNNATINLGWSNLSSDASTYYKIATLASSSNSTYDNLRMEVVLNSTWLSNYNTSLDMLFSNRNSFVYSYMVNGKSPTNVSGVKVVAYNNNGLVDIYIYHATGAYTTASVTVLNNLGETVYPTPPTTTSPSGTLVFDSSSGSYPPTTASDFSGNFTVNNQSSASYFTALSTSNASTFPYASTTALTVSAVNGLTLNSSLNGLLFGTNGAVSSVATSSLGLLGSSTVSSLASNYVPKWMGSSFANSRVYDNGTNVGIGTTTPGYDTQIAGAESSAANNTTIGSILGVTQNTFETHGIYQRLRGNSAGISGLVYANQLFSSNGYAFEIYSTAGQPLVFGTAATEAMRIINGGNVGIGTTTPTNKLEVAGSGYFAGNLTGTNITATGTLAVNGTATINTLNLTNDLSVASGGTGASTLTGVLKGNGASAFTAMNGIANYTTRWTDANTIGTGLLYDNGTNVGIGTSTPAAALQINGGNSYGQLLLTNNSQTNSLAGLGIEGSAGGIVGGSSKGDFSLWTTSRNKMNFSANNGVSAQMVLNSSGNVGIGTTTPANKLAISTTAPGDGITIDSNGTVIGTIAQRATVGATIGLGIDGVSGRPISIGGAVNTNVLLAAAGGNVGIGTTTPATMLELGIGGDIRLNGVAGYYGQISDDGGEMSYNAVGAGTFQTWKIAGQEKMRLDPSGNIGIGTTTPNNVLTLQAGSTNQGLSILNNFTTGKSVANLYSYNGAGALDLFQTNGSTIGSKISGNENVNSYLNAGGGNVGIGTTSPLSRLAIQGTGNTSASSALNVAGLDGGSHLFVRDDGNVGIGTTSPQTQLDVSTTAQIGSNYGTWLGFNILPNRTIANGRISSMSASTDDNIVLNGKGNGGIWTGYDDGAGGLRIYNGAGGITSLFTGTIGTTYINKNGGSVGVGTTSPSQIFSVQGGGLFSGNITAANMIATGTLSSLGNATIGGTLNVTGATTLASTLNGLLLATNGLVSSVATSSLGLGASFFQQNGNSFGATATIGTNDAQSLSLETNGSAKMTILSGGNIGIGMTSPVQTLDMAAGGAYGYNGVRIITASTTLQNYFFGGNAGNFTTTGTGNTGVGYSVLASVTSGVNNQAFGAYALSNSTTAGNNSAFGIASLNWTTTGSNNTAYGYGTLDYNVGGANNVAVGYNAGHGDGTIDQRSVIDTNMTFIGYQASRDGSIASTTSLANATAIGYNAKVGASNSLVLGGTGGYAVNVGIGTSSPYSAYGSIATGLDVANAGTGNSGITISNGTDQKYSYLQFFRNRVNANGVGGWLRMQSNAAVADSKLEMGVNTNLSAISAATSSARSVFRLVGANYGFDGAYAEIGRFAPSSVADANNPLIPNLRFTSIDSTGNNEIQYGAVGARVMSSTTGSLAGDLVFYSRPNSALTEGMRLTSTGGLAVGTTSTMSDSAFEVACSAGGNCYNAVRNNSIYGAGMRMISGGVSARIRASVGSISLDTSTGNDVIFLASSTNNVGIGTTTPIARLSMQGTGSGELLDIASSAGSSLLHLTSSGKLGVGTASPLQNIDMTSGAYGYNGMIMAAAANVNRGNWFFGSAGGAAGSLSVNAGAGLMNTAVGSSSMLSANTGSYNTAVGANTLKMNAYGSNNSAFGVGALMANSTAFNNSAFGVSALGTNYSGGNNSAFGASALASNYGGSNNVAFGYQTLYTNSSGGSNVAVGNSAMYLNTTGADNNAIGVSALGANDSGSENSAIGTQALGANVSGGYNVALGSFAGYGDGTTDQQSSVDTYMTFIGANATRDASTPTATALTNSTAIGYNARVFASNQMVLGSDAVLSTLLKGNVGIGTTNPLAKLHIHGDYNNTGAGGFMLDASDSSDPNKYSLRINPYAVGSSKVGYKFVTTSSVGGTSTPLTFDNVGNVSFGGNLNLPNGIWNSSGNVGIGTTSLAQALTVQGDSLFNGNLTVAGSSKILRLLNTDTGGGDWTLYATKNSEPVLDYNIPAGMLALRQTGTMLENAPFVIGSSGNIGINMASIAALGSNTIDPSYPLTVGGTGYFSGNVIAKGSIGIGTTSPTGALGVAGSAYIGGNLTATGTLSVGNSLAFGPYSSGGQITSSFGSIAGGSVIGGNITASGNGSLAIGYLVGSTGLSALRSTGGGSFAAGTVYYGTTTSSGNGSLAMGYAYNSLITSSGSGSLAFGYANNSPLTATGQGSVALGESVNATANNAFALGKGFTNATASTFQVGFTSSPMLTVTATNVGIGTTTDGYNPTQPGKLTIDMGSLASENAVDVHGTINDFLEYNITNHSSGTSAQSGFSATADTGSLTTGFAWFGINNSTFWNPTAYNVGGALDSTLMSSSNDLYVAQVIAGKKTHFLNGGVSTSTNEVMTFSGNNIGIGTSSPFAKLAISAGSYYGYNPIIFAIASSTNGAATTTLFSVASNGAVSMGSSTATTTINGFLDVLGTGTNATSTIAKNLWVKGALRANLSYVGDLIFANDFAFVESSPINSTTTQALYLKSQKGDHILNIDDAGNLNVMGDICSGNNTCVNESISQLSANVGALASSTSDLQSGFNSKIQTTSSSVQSLADAIVSLNVKVDALASATSTNADYLVASASASLASSTPFISKVASSTATVLITNASFVTSVADAVKNMISAGGNWVLDRLTAHVIYTDRIEAGTVAISRGMEIVDQTTGATWCVTIKSGDWSKVQGTCAAVASTTAATAETAVAPVIVPPASDALNTATATAENQTANTASASNAISEVAMTATSTNGNATLTASTSVSGVASSTEIGNATTTASTSVGGTSEANSSTTPSTVNATTTSTSSDLGINSSATTSSSENSANAVSETPATATTPTADTSATQAASVPNVSATTETVTTP